MAPPNQPPTVRPSGPQQQTGFYQEPTEAISALPDNNALGYPANYPQQGFAGTPAQGGYAGSQVQPFQAGGYTRHGYQQMPTSQAGQSYAGYPPQPRLTPPIPPPRKQQNNTILVIASVLLVVALIAVIAFGALYLSRANSSPKVSITPTPVPTSVPSPTPTPSPMPTATPTPVPSPTLAPTPAPDANFVWCGATCTSNGFIVEYPIGWNQGQTVDKTGVQFLNPAQSDQYAAFKTPGPTTSNASDLVTNDLQTNFASQPGYVAPTTMQSATIGGVNWTYAIAHYTLNNQTEQVRVYATPYQGKAYIIEVQATDGQFDSANTQYFNTMTSKFQFQQSTP
jgi:hypothetical protein